eukprot:2210246-Pyramimonas_sp.AAC.1
MKRGRTRRLPAGDATYWSGYLFVACRRRAHRRRIRSERAVRGPRLPSASRPSAEPQPRTRKKPRGGLVVKNFTCPLGVGGVRM